MHTYSRRSENPIGAKAGIITISICGVMFNIICCITFVKAMGPEPGSKMILMANAMLMPIQLLAASILLAIALYTGQYLGKGFQYITILGLMSLFSPPLLILILAICGYT